MIYIPNIKSLTFKEFMYIIKENIHSNNLDISNAYKTIKIKEHIKSLKRRSPKYAIDQNYIITKIDNENEDLTNYFIYSEKIKAKKAHCISRYDLIYGNHPLFDEVLREIYKMIILSAEKDFFVHPVALLNFMKNNELCKINSPEVSRFSIFGSISAYKLYRPTRILDPCIGWGERLIAALLANIKEYHGYDPSLKLFEKYKVINKTIRKITNSKTTIRIHNTQFEYDIVPEDYFDLVFTSPPSFDNIIYNNEFTQASNLYTERKKYLDYFITPLFLKSIKSLKDRGTLLIHYPYDKQYIHNLLISNDMKKQKFSFIMNEDKKKIRFLTYVKVDKN